jgi:hypothetical protein
MRGSPIRHSWCQDMQEKAAVLDQREGPMKLSLTLAIMGTATVCVRAGAQSPLTGFWQLAGKECVPASGRCSAAESNSWSARIAIDARHDTVVLTSLLAVPSNPWGAPYADTLRVDGKIIRWLAHQRGISRDVSSPQVAVDNRPAGSSRALWPGESWTLSSDGGTLLHELQWKDADGSDHRMTWSYHRSAG